MAIIDGTKIGLKGLGRLKSKLYIPKVLSVFRFHPKLKCLDDENFVIGWSR